MFRRFAARFGDLSSARPLLIRAGVGTGIFFVGDFTAQQLDHRWGQSRQAKQAQVAQRQTQQQALEAEFEWDAARSARICSWRAVVFTPLAVTFWGILDRVVTVPGLPGTALKVGLDLATLAPPSMFSFFVWNRTLEGGGLASVPEAVNYAMAKVPSALGTLYVYWLPIHFLTYGVVPIAHRLIWMNVWSCGFAVMMSWLNARKGDVSVWEELGLAPSLLSLGGSACAIV